MSEPTTYEIAGRRDGQIVRWPICGWVVDGTGGLFAVDERSPGNWCVTHLPSGFALPSVVNSWPTRAAAIAVALKFYEVVGPYTDLECNDPSALGFNSLPLRKRQHIRALLQHTGWSAQ